MNLNFYFMNIKSTVTLIMILGLFLICPKNLFAQQTNYQDVVIFKDGSFVKGIIQKDIPGYIIKLKLSDGSVNDYYYSDILGFTKEDGTFLFETKNIDNEKRSNKSLSSYIPKWNSEKNKPSISATSIDNRTRKILEGGISIHPSQKSIFVMYGVTKNRLGYYLKLKTNLKFLNESDEISSNSECFCNGDRKTERIAISGGGLYKLTNSLLIQGGIGYGSRLVNWESISGNYYRVSDISYKGIHFETGFIYQLKKYVISGSLTSISTNYMEVDLGVGIIL